MGNMLQNNRLADLMNRGTRRREENPTGGLVSNIITRGGENLISTPEKEVAPTNNLVRPEVGAISRPTIGGANINRPSPRVPRNRAFTLPRQNPTGFIY